MSERLFILLFLVLGWLPFDAVANDTHGLHHETRGRSLSHTSKGPMCAGRPIGPFFESTACKKTVRKTYLASGAPELVHLSVMVSVMASGLLHK